MKYWILFVCLSFSSLFSKEKYNLSVCAIFANETKYLKEWIEYHRLVGVDHFYLYSNNSADNPSEMLAPFIQEDTVTLTHWLDPLGVLAEQDPVSWAQSTQVTAYENAIQMRKEETKWLVFLDVNEFLVPSSAMSISAILEKYNQYNSIEIFSRFFDASLKHSTKEKSLVLENFDLIGSPLFNLNKTVKKVIIKPKFCKKFTWPPYQPAIDDEEKTISLSEGKISVNHYVNRKECYVSSSKRRIKIDNRLLVGDEENEILNQGYEFEDKKKPVKSFLDELQKKMECE